MPRFSRILVPVDFSAQSSQAIRYGCAFARLGPSPLFLLHAIQDLAPISIGGAGVVVSTAAQYLSDLEVSAQQALQSVPDPKLSDGISVFRQTLIGSPAESIIDFARENDIGLICIGTHGRGGISRFLLGSVAEKVVQRASCSVLVVHQREREFVTGDQTVPRIRRILVPVDFSEHAGRAIGDGAELASRAGAELHLLHVVEDSSPAVSEIALAYPVFQSYVRELTQAGQKQLDALEVPGIAAGSVQRRVVVGSAISKITDYASEHEVDLIVMSTHGRTGPSHWLLGSVAERVVRSAPCPVLVSRPAAPAKS